MNSEALSAALQAVALLHYDGLRAGLTPGWPLAWRMRPLKACGPRIEAAQYAMVRIAPSMVGGELIGPKLVGEVFARLIGT